MTVQPQAASSGRAPPAASATALPRCLQTPNIQVKTMPIPAFTTSAATISIRSAMAMHCVQGADHHNRPADDPPPPPGQEGRTSPPTTKGAAAACVTVAWTEKAAGWADASPAARSAASSWLQLLQLTADRRSAASGRSRTRPLSPRARFTCLGGQASGSARPWRAWGTGDQRGCPLRPAAAHPR